MAELFRLTPSEALRIVAGVGRATARWAETAARRGQTKKQIDEMAPAFEHPQASAALHG